MEGQPAAPLRAAGRPGAGGRAQRWVVGGWSRAPEGVGAGIAPPGLR